MICVQTFGDIPTGEMVSTDEYQFANRYTWERIAVKPDIILEIGKGDAWLAYLEAMASIGRGEFENLVADGRRSYLLEPKTVDERKADTDRERAANKRWIADQKSLAVRRQAAREGVLELF